MSDTTDPNAGDTARDAWLSAALRHAPDAQAAPSEALSAAILRQARAAPTSASGPLPRGRLAALLAAAWNGLARPPVAAGFASVMVATVIGLMWWDQPIDPTPTRAPAADSSPPAAPPPGNATSAARAPEAEERPLDASPAAPSVTPTPQAAREGAPARRQAKRPEQSTAPAAAPPAPPAPSETMMAPEAAQASVSAAAAPAAETMRLHEEPAPRAAAAAKAAANTVAPLADAAVPARPAALSALLASVASEPKRWGWQRDEAIRPMSPALQQWLLQLDTATATRWRGGAGNAAVTGTLLRFYRDGSLAATLQFGDEDIVFSSPASRATLAPAALAALRQSLDDVTR